ncbi:hypothetical protein TRVL_07707 [Trypanosoma vivax]|nr:hypothetical protein TRVL_07707 [Trypanosoma vivax]
MAFMTVLDADCTTAFEQVPRKGCTTAADNRQQGTVGGEIDGKTHQCAERHFHHHLARVFIGRTPKPTRAQRLSGHNAIACCAACSVSFIMKLITGMTRKIGLA